MKEAPLHFIQKLFCFHVFAQTDSFSVVVTSGSSKVIFLFLSSSLNDMFSMFDLCMYDDEGMYCHNVRFPFNFYVCLSSPVFPAGTHTKRETAQLSLKKPKSREKWKRREEWTKTNKRRKKTFKHRRRWRMHGTAQNITQKWQKKYQISLPSYEKIWL